MAQAEYAEVGHRPGEGVIDVTAARGVPIVVAVLVSTLVGVALGSEGAEPAPTPLASASKATGSLSIDNSLNSGAILSVAGLAPGQSASGEVTIKNSGSLEGALTLESEALAEVPGLGGGLLSERLELVVLEPGAGVVYQGPYGGLGRRSLGAIAAGQGRRYRFTATLPEGGVPLSPSAGDNAYQGARLSSAFRWTATNSAPDDPTGSKLSLRVELVKHQRIPRSRRLVIYARCSQPCAVAARAKFRRGRSKLARRRTVRANQRVKLSLRLSRRSARRLARAAARRRGARLTLKVSARDGAGRRATFSRRVRLRQVRRGGRKRVARWSTAKKTTQRRGGR